MGPLPNELPKSWINEDSTTEGEDYEQDGWQIGFPVEINGFGIEHIISGGVGVEANSSSDSDGYDGPGDGSDADDPTRVGYQPLPTGVPSEATEDMEPEHELVPISGGITDPTFERLQAKINAASVSAKGSLLSSVRTDFEEAIKSADSVHLSDADFNVTAAKFDSIELNSEKIDIIRKAASQMKLAPPAWANNVDDAKLAEILNKLKKN